MKGYRFYEELENKNRKAENSKGTVVALLIEPDGRGWKPLYLPRLVRTKDRRGWSYAAECVSSVFAEPNSPVASGSVSMEYLSKDCRRISEARAREIHPELFKYLEG